jgi:hypothetical protein
VADRRDDRNVRGGDGADHLLLVERPQILDRAAAAGDDQQVRDAAPARRPKRVESGDAAAILRRRAFALDRDRPEDDVAGEAILEPVQDVADDGAGRRGDHADDLGRERQPCACGSGSNRPLGGQRSAALVELGP